MTFRYDAPNELQLVPLRLIVPSKDNVRLFVERESLSALRSRYRAHGDGQTVVLPDAPIIRLVGEVVDFATDKAEPLFELLAGERRLTAATLENLKELPCRIAQMSDAEAYNFILEHNDVASITTVELAFRAAEMERLGFADNDISARIGGGAVYRYLTVGELVNPKWFTDTPKLCNPSIVEWYEAALFGAEHFKYCFDHWNQGLWDEKKCAKMFRRRGIALPIDNAEKGFRITFDMNRLVVRGQLDLDLVDNATAVNMLDHLRHYLNLAQGKVTQVGQFGPREVFRINPETV